MGAGVEGDKEKARRKKRWVQKPKTKNQKPKTKDQSPKAQRTMILFSTIPSRHFSERHLLSPALSSCLLPLLLASGTSGHEPPNAPVSPEPPNKPNPPPSEPTP